MSEKIRLLVQLLGTLLILAFVPTNTGKAIVLIGWWGITFGRLTLVEIVFFWIACAFFLVMNLMSLRQGIFQFVHPDFLGMPVYELFMWGFYLLHTKRILGGAIPTGSKLAGGLAGFYAIAFSTISDPTLLLVVTSVLLVVGLILFHDPYDFAYVGYMVFLGAVIEYTGVYSGEWFYPANPPGGVPLWFVTLWGGVGLFLRRLVLPILARHESKIAAAAT